MNIETKCNIGDKVYTIYEKRIQYTEIKGITITVKNGVTQIEYNIMGTVETKNNLWCKEVVVPENLVFKVKGELQQYLFSDDNVVGFPLPN